jgi:signal transduction histidine kinase
MIVEPDGGLVVRAVAGRVACWQLGVRVPAADTLAWSAVRERTPVTAELRGCRHRHERELAGAGVRRVCYLPVPAHGSATGVLGVGYGGGTVIAREPGLLEPLAAVAGLVPTANDVECAVRRAGVEEQAAVGERERLARELHDTVEQTLYGISLGAGTAGELVRHDPGLAHQSIEWIQQTAVGGLADLRGIILRLRPEALATNGLTVALVRLLEPLKTLHGCRTIAELGPEPVASAETQQTLYRIAQEAVLNAAKHARAAKVTLRLHTRGPTVVLEVIDDGEGFTPGGEFPGRLGVRSMRERAMEAGGQLEIISELGGGTAVRALLPVDT